MHPSPKLAPSRGMLVAAILLPTLAFAQGPAFHVAGDGDDSRSGLSPQQAWRTLQRVNQALLSDEIQAGARVLLRAGDTFRGSIRLQGNDAGLEFGRYGLGAPPRLSGARALGPWIPLGADRWAAAAPARAEFVHRDGVRLPLARAPNEGAFYTDACTENLLTSAAVAGLPLLGGTLVLRNYDWSFVRLPVLAQSGAQLTFAALPEAPGDGRNFYVEGLPLLLDAPGEWWQDPQTLTIVLQLGPGEQPTASAFEAVVDSGGIVGDWNRQNIRIEGLEFVHYADAAIDLRGALCAGNEVRDCIVRDGGNGIDVWGAGAALVGNQLRDLCLGAIFGRTFGPNSTVSANRIERIGLAFGVAAASATGEFLVDGIDVDCLPGARIADNTLDELGYNGIRVDGVGALVEHNHITDVLRVLTDGGGIYSFGQGSNGLTIRENVVERVWGNPDGARYVGGVGIYLDNFTDSCIVERNVVVDAFSAGYTVNAGATNHRLADNIAWGSGHGAMLSNWLPQPVAGNRLEGNLLYTLSEDAFPLVLQSNDGWFQMATYDRNRYFQPYGPYAVLASAYAATPRYTLAGWRLQNPGSDLLSREHFVRLPARSATRELGPERLQNGTFASGIASWASWAPAGSSAVAAWVQPAAFGGGALRLVVAPASGGPGSAAGVAYQAGFAVQQGQWYRVRCRLQATAPIDVNLQIQRHYGDYSVLSSLRYLPADTKVRAHEFCWRAPFSDGPVRLNFWLDAPGTIFVDDVSLQPVAVRSDSARQRSPIFVNASATVRTVALAGSHRDMNGQPAGAVITVPPWSARVLVRDD